MGFGLVSFLISEGGRAGSDAGPSFFLCFLKNILW